MNRYIRGEHGDYIRVAVAEPARRQPVPPPFEPPRKEPASEPPREPPLFDPPHEPPPVKPFPLPPPPPPDAMRFLGRLLEQFKDVDSGDLLLLLILFFLFREKADDEALIALGLLLIL